MIQRFCPDNNWRLIPYTRVCTSVQLCTLCDGVDPWMRSEQSAEELLLPERILWGGHRGDEGVVAGVRVAVRHQVGCCLWYLQIRDDVPQIKLHSSFSIFLVQTFLHSLQCIFQLRCGLFPRLNLHLHGLFKKNEIKSRVLSESEACTCVCVCLTFILQKLASIFSCSTSFLAWPTLMVLFTGVSPFILSTTARCHRSYHHLPFIQRTQSHSARHNQLGRMWFELQK